MKIVTSSEGDCRVVAIYGSADVNASETLRHALLGAIESGATRIICDLGQADFIGSDSLSILIMAYLKARGRGGFVRLANPQARVREILDEMRLDRLFEVYRDVKCAAL
jgi:anti-sigma B factor antagonist